MSQTSNYTVLAANVAERIMGVKPTILTEGKNAGKQQYVLTTRTGKKVWSFIEPNLQRQNVVIFNESQANDTKKITNLFEGFGYEEDTTARKELLTHAAGLGMTNALTF